MGDEITFQVQGLPPAKSEALSMLGAGHRHADRVTRLLRAAQTAAQEAQFAGFGTRPVGLELTVSCARDGQRSDATNFLGGVADVLEEKSRRGALDHLGELSGVWLYANDNQIERVAYTWRPASQPSYVVRLWALER